VNIYRQGDVLVVQIDSIPADAAAEKIEDRIVLAYGEVTGHAHAISKEEAVSYKVDSPIPIFDWRAERFLLVAVKAQLKHEEHATIDIPAGNYAVIQQREYSPEEIRNVAD